MSKRLLALPTIQVVVTFHPRPGEDGHDIKTAAIADTSGHIIALPSWPDCSYRIDPLRLSTIGVTVSLAPLREQGDPAR